MSREKQIEEMAVCIPQRMWSYNIVERCVEIDKEVRGLIAEHLYRAGYRKQSEGEWVTKGDFFKTYHCSLCNYSVDYPWQRTSYCPRCGAKMGGGAE